MNSPTLDPSVASAMASPALLPNQAAVYGQSQIEAYFWGIVMGWM